MNSRLVIQLFRAIGSASVLAGLAGCSAETLLPTAPIARRPNVIPDPQLRNNPRLAEGQLIFMQHCNQCHVGGAAGLAPSLNDKRLPTWFIKFQVRHGLGAMPAYSERVVDDSQLDDVVTYIRYLRQHPDGAGQG
jgi:mono/diheme cytochrome c family protein